MEGNARTASTSIRLGPLLWRPFNHWIVPVAQAQRAANFNQAGVQKSSKPRCTEGKRTRSHSEGKGTRSCRQLCTGGTSPGTHRKPFTSSVTVFRHRSGYARYYDFFTSVASSSTCVYAVPRFSNVSFGQTFWARHSADDQADVDGGTNYAIAGRQFPGTATTSTEMSGLPVDQFLAATSGASQPLIIWLEQRHRSTASSRVNTNNSSLWSAPACCRARNF